VDDGEFVGVVGGEEWREDAVLGAPPPEQLARRARRPTAHVADNPGQLASCFIYIYIYIDRQ